MNAHMMNPDQFQSLQNRILRSRRDCEDLEQNMKNIIQSMYKIANVGFGYKRMQKEIKALKVN